MKLCRFSAADGLPRVGVVVDDARVRDLGTLVGGLSAIFEREDPVQMIETLDGNGGGTYSIADVRLLPPVDGHEIWAAGVTYLRSKVARMEESDFSATAYDRVYEADRPELFFKCLPDKAAGPGTPVGIRRDAKWSVPEPELALVFNSRGRLAGVTIGNDMSSRDIEGENLLYLPQAKIYDRSCSLGPWIVVGESEAAIRSWTIDLDIQRNGASAFHGATSVSQIKRSFDSLGEFLFRSQSFARGAVLLTGTGIVPPDSFTLQPGDVVNIEISGIGTLSNSVVVV
jgi:2-dehydro-3-deoxy-D-arabinonate dehydratase